MQGNICPFTDFSAVKGTLKWALLSTSLKKLLGNESNTIRKIGKEVRKKSRKWHSP